MELYFTFFECLLATITILVVVIYLIYYKKNSTDSRYPPGPRSLPLLGNVLQIGSDPLRVFQKWADEYGLIYSIKMGTQNTIILSDPKLVKELFSHTNSTGRPANPITHYIGGGNGVAHSQGTQWESQRRFVLRALRDFGVFKSSIEELLVEESTRLVEYFKKTSGQPISSTKLFNGPVVNSLWKIITGDRNDWDSPAGMKIIQYSNAVFESINVTVRSGLFFAPFLRFIAPGHFGWTNFVNACDKFNNLIDSAIKTHAEKLDTNNHHDFIDHYLVEMRKCKDPNSSFYQRNGEENLEAVIGDLFAAGSETNSGTLSFALLYLIQNQDAQIKAQREIDQRIGSSRPISLSDKTLLPYTEAILLETLRLSSVTPLGAPHRMIADTIFCNYVLPKDTTVIANLYGIHHDPKIWGEDVNEFRPERFLSKDETRVIRHDALMPFSAGKRQCLGESLAKDTIFLFIAGILQNFDIEADPGTPILNSETPSGLLVEPQSYKFVLKRRNSEKL